MLDDDGLPLDEVGVWAKEKHERLHNVATSKELQAVFKRNGESVVCPEFGTRYPAAA
jgi:hypothetical protein